MSKYYYLGLNANGPKIAETLFTHGTSKDLRKLSEFLSGKYQGAPILTKNGRSAIYFALKSYFEPGDKIIINGFTCYAVYEAVTKAGMTPIFADINVETLNYNIDTLEKIIGEKPKGIIIQNSLGNPVNIKQIKKFADDHDLMIIEDLAHLAGADYTTGDEVGTVGDATVLSFGKDKAVNTVSGGAVILRTPAKHSVDIPVERPRFSDYLRSRFYPFLCAMCRGLNHIHLGGILMRCLVRIHFIEKSADNKLDEYHRLGKFQAKLALKQIKNLKGARTRDFYLVDNRDEVLKKLRDAGFFFDSFWYEKPVSPKRYYKEVGYPEKACPIATKVAEKIINFPLYYSKKDLKKAFDVVKSYIITDEELISMSMGGRND